MTTMDDRTRYGRTLEKRIVLPATREQVWEAISTGPGVSTWFVQAEAEAAKDGHGRADFGAGASTVGRALIFEPGKRIVLGGFHDDVGQLGDAAAGERREPRRRDEPPDFALEFWITESDERGTVLYLRQRGFPEAGLELFDRGWDVAFHTLAEYFKHFAGRQAVTTTALVLPLLEREVMWNRMRRGLGADRELSVGDQIEVSRRGESPIAGEVDLLMTGPPLDVLGIRTEDGFIRAMADETCGGVVNRFTYVVDPVDAALRQRSLDEGAAWQAWLEQEVVTP
jgi:uncharacterized protein YndB with AHSA1/START domain